MPSTHNKIPRAAEATLPEVPEFNPTVSSANSQGESENDLEAILFSLLGSEKGKQKMKELQAKEKYMEKAADLSPDTIATTVPSDTEDHTTSQAGPEEAAYVLESAQAKSAWREPPGPLATNPPVPRYPDYPVVATAPRSTHVPPVHVPPPPPSAPPDISNASRGMTRLMYAPWAKVCESGPGPVNAQQLQAQSQLQAQRVLGIRSDKSKGASWTLAWCADFNRVEIHSSLKDQLHQLVMSKGGVVVPFWSARGLSKWLQSSGNVPYVMLADLSVLDMSVRSTTLHHRKEKVNKKPVHIFVPSYEDNVEEVKSAPPVVQSVQTSVISFNEFGFRDMASQAVLMVLGLS